MGEEVLALRFHSAELLSLCEDILVSFEASVQKAKRACRKKETNGRVLRGPLDVVVLASRQRARIHISGGQHFRFS